MPRARALPLLLFIVCLSVLATPGSLFKAGAGSTRARSDYNPSAAAIAQANNTFPAANAELYANSEYNFTAGLRRPTYSGNPSAPDWTPIQEDVAGNLYVTKEGNFYSNTSLTPLGAFNATYSFANDRDGGPPAGFTDVGSGVREYPVLASYLGHQKVFRSTYTSGGSTNLRQYLSSVQSGTGTFSTWWATSQTTGGNLVLSYDTAVTGNIFNLYFSGGWLYSEDAGADTPIFYPVANRWYYLQISFDIPNHVMDIHIDGRLILDNTPTSSTTVTDMNWIATSQSTAGSIYFDGWDYSWTPGWYANRSAVDLGQLGHYNSTDSFSAYTPFQTAAQFGGDWTDNSDAGCIVRQMPLYPLEATSHGDILSLEDVAPDANTASIYRSAPDVESGSLEAWFRFSHVSYQMVQFYVFDGGVGGTVAFGLYVYVNNWYTANSGADATFGVTPTSTKWWHCRIDFDCGTGTFNLYIDGILRAWNVAFENAVPHVDTVRTYNGGVASDTGIIQYVDGWDCSWENDHYYSERSTYLRLNSTQSFPSAGAYSYRYSIFSSTGQWEQPAVPFTVRENVQFVSESPEATVWWINGMTQYETLYAQPFDTLDEKWQLAPGSGISNISMSAELTGDAYVANGIYAGTNYGSEGYVTATYVGGAITRGFYKFAAPTYFCENLTNIATFYAGSSYIPQTVHFYTSSAFDESTITWNNQPAAGTLLLSAGYSSTWGWQTFSLHSNTSFVFRTSVDEAGGNKGFSTRSRETAEAPSLRLNISKSWQGISSNYWSGSGFAYVQTNVTESFTYSSPQTLSLSLRTFDRLNIAFDFPCSHPLELRLKHAGETQASFALAREHENPGQKTLSFIIMDDIAVDQIEVAGSLDPTVYDWQNWLILDQISILRPTSGFEILEPFGIKPVSLPAGHLVEVFDKFNTTSTFWFDGTEHVLLHHSINVQTRQVTYYTPEGVPADPNLFWVNCTRTYENVTASFVLAGNQFLADDGSVVRFEIRDYFQNSLVNHTQLISNFINITIPLLYSLKVQNLMATDTHINLSLNSSTQTEKLLPGEVIEYMLYSATYYLTYTQTETGQFVNASIPVTGARTYIINTSYYSVYVSCYSPLNPAIPREQFRLYVNDSLRDWGFVSFLADPWNLTVRDWFNNSLFSQVLWLNATSELVIPVDVHLLKVQNKMRNDTTITLAQAGINLNADVLADDIEELYLAAGTYTLAYTHTETGASVSTSLAITGATRYVINSSYYTVWFNAHYGPVGLDEMMLRLYVDGARHAFGPVEILGASHAVQVRDYWGDVLYAGTLNLAGATECLISVPCGTVIFANKFNFSCNAVISKNGIDLVKASLPASASLPYPVTTGTYTVQFYYENMTYIKGEDETFSIAANATATVDFGFATIEADLLDPTGAWFVFAIIAFVVIGVVVVLAVRARKNNRYRDLTEIENMMKSARGAGTVYG